MRRSLAVVAVLVVLVVCTSCFAGVGAAAHEEPARTGIFGVELGADGDAVVYNVTAFDLSDDAQRDRYESIADNETALEEWRTDVAAELEAAAATGRNETDLEMRVDNVTVRADTVVDETDNETTEYGRIEVRAEWSQLAYHSGAYELEGRDSEWVLVTEPFRGGFEPGPTRVAVHGPVGYERSVDSQPPQVRAQRNSMLWNPQTSNFSNFYALFTAIDDGGGESDGGESGGGDGGTDGGGDGGGGTGTFLVALALALVPVAVVLLAVRQRR